MEELFRIENELINQPIENLILGLLSNNFETNKNRKVLKIDRVTITSITVDVKSSNIRENIIINRVDATAQVWVEFIQETKKNGALNLRISDTINLIFNKELKEYQIENTNILTLNDLSY
jgi:hypothetical protein